MHIGMRWGVWDGMDGMHWAAITIRPWDESMALVVFLISSWVCWAVRTSEKVKLEAAV